MRSALGPDLALERLRVEADRMPYRNLELRQARIVLLYIALLRTSSVLLRPRIYARVGGLGFEFSPVGELWTRPC